MTSPELSVVMSVYNGQQYIKAAIDSILQQTWENFEFIIVDDGSTDYTADIIHSYNDKRIKLLSRKHSGLVNSLNAAVSVANSPWIARQDGDDISDPQRFEKQMRALKENPELILLGTNRDIIDAQGNSTNGTPIFLSDYEIKSTLILGNKFCHGSVIMNKEAFYKAGGYNEKFMYAEDYQLWWKMASIGKVENLPQILYHYREHDQCISQKKRELQEQAALRISKAILRDWCSNDRFSPAMKAKRPQRLTNPLPDSQYRTADHERLLASLLTELGAILILNRFHKCAEWTLTEATHWGGYTVKRGIALALNRFHPDLCYSLTNKYARNRLHLRRYIQSSDK